MAPKTKKNSPKYQKVLDAAANVFRKKGYHNASISDIAESVGMLKGSLYYYIESKDELLESLVLSALDSYRHSLEDILTANEPADTIIKKAVAAYMNPVDISLDRRAVFLFERHNLQGPAKKRINKQIVAYEKLWLDVFDQGKKEGIIRDDVHTPVLLHSFFGMANWTLSWYEKKGLYSLEQIGDIYTSIFLDGVRKQ